VEEEWDVARQACVQCFELGKSVIAKAEAGGNWEVMAGIVVAGMGLRKSFSQNWDFARPEQNGLRHSLSFSFLSSSRMASNLFLSGQ
jgi:hypothetical protein